MSDNLCPECKEREVDPDLDTCLRCFLEQEFDEYRATSMGKPMLDEQGNHYWA